MPPDIILDFHPAQNQNRPKYLLKRLAEHAQRENEKIPCGKFYCRRGESIL